MYQAAIETIRKEGAAIYMDEDVMFKAIEKQAKDGIDFMAIHCSVNRRPSGDSRGRAVRVAL